MAKRKSKKESLDFKNSRYKELGYNFSIRENRMTKDEARQILGRNEFKRLFDSKFIVESDKKSGYVKLSEKFIKQFKSKVDKDAKFHNSNSEKHNQAIRKALDYVPDKAIAQGRFKSEEQMKEEMNRVVRRVGFKAEFEKMREENRQQLLVLRDKYNADLAAARNDYERNMLSKQYQEEKANAEVYYKVLNQVKTIDLDNQYIQVKSNDKSYSSADFAVSYTREEAEALYEKLQRDREYIEERLIYERSAQLNKEYEMLLQNESKVEQMISVVQEEYIVSFEATTSSYTSKEIAQKEVYSRCSGGTTLFFHA